MSAKSKTRPAQLLERLEPRAYFALTFGAPTSIPITASDTGVLQPPAIADFNGDGKPDLAIANATNDSSANGSVAIALNDGAGNFTLGAAVNAVFTGRPRVGDFNGDGKNDVAVADSFNNVVRVFVGNGDGTLQAALPFTVGTSPQDVAVKDLNKDGKDDLVANNRGPDGDTGADTITLLLGNSTGTVLGSPSTVTVGDDPASAVIADVDGDGKLNVLVGNAGPQAATTGTLQTLLGNGDGTFQNTTILTNGPRGVSAVADMDSDGIPDVIVSITEDGTPTVLKGNGDGTFAATLTTGNQFLVDVADVSGDGKQDIIGSGVTDNAVSVLTGVGDGTFNAKQDFTVSSPGIVVAGDLNGDNKPDLALANDSGGPVISTLLNTSDSSPPAGTGVDLTAAVTGKFPVSVVAGQTKGKFTVTVTNSSTDTALAKTPVTVKLFASNDTTVGGDTEIASATKNLKLKPGKSKAIKLSFKFPAVPTDGAYHIVAQVDTEGTVAEANENNNTADGASTVTIAAPFVDLSTAFATPVPSPLTPGGKATFVPSVQNLGNVAAKGKATVTFVASTDNVAGGSDDVPLGTVEPKVSIKSGKTKKLKLKLVLPGTIAPGSYFVIATVNPLTGFADSATGNNTAVSGEAASVA